MASLEWVVVTLLVFAALQALLVRRAIRRREAESGAEEGLPWTPDAHGGEMRRPGDDEILCPHCGTRNRTDFTYCRNCVNPVAG